MKNEYYALVPTNSTTKQIETHKLYFQNSVVCLQADWWNAFSFVKTAFNTLFKFVYEVPDSDENKYECANPFIKLKHKKTEMKSKIIEMN